MRILNKSPVWIVKNEIYGKCDQHGIRFDKVGFMHESVILIVKLLAAKNGKV